MISISVQKERCFGIIINFSILLTSLVSREIRVEKREKRAESKRTISGLVF